MKLKNKALFLDRDGVINKNFKSEFLSKNGKIKLWSVNMKPGKPLAFGSLKRNGQSPLPHIGLPGNPVSSLVAFHQFVRPAIYKMMGRKTMDIPTIKAVLENKIENTDGRRVYARVLVSNKNGEFHARLSGSQASNVLIILFLFKKAVISDSV